MVGAFKEAFGEENVGKGPTQRNMGVHSLRHMFIMLCVARSACGNKNATNTQMRKDARMSLDTLTRYLRDCETILEAHKSQGATWREYVGFDYRPMWISNPTALAGVGKMLSRGRLAEFVFARHGEDVGFVEGFVEKILQQKNSDSTRQQFFSVWDRVEAIMHANTDASRRCTVDLERDGEQLAKYWQELASLMMRVRVLPPIQPPSSSPPVSSGSAQANSNATTAAAGTTLTFSPLPAAPAPPNSATDRTMDSASAAVIPPTLSAPKSDSCEREGAASASHAPTQTLPANPVTAAGLPSSVALGHVHVSRPNYISQSQFARSLQQQRQQIVAPRVSSSAQPLVPAVAESTSYKAARNEIMRGFQAKDLAGQVASLLRVYEEIPKFKELFDENMAAAKTDLPDDSDKQFYNKRLKPFLRCYKECSGGQLETFRAKNENLPTEAKARLAPDRKDPERIVFKLRNWTGSCACKAKTT